MIFLISILSGLLYRMGGVGKPFHPKYRDFGCPLVLLLLVWLWFGFQWVPFLSTFVLSYFALLTYWDRVFKYDNFYAHGLGCGLAGLPLLMIVPWWLVVGRLLVCTVGMGLWSRFIDNDVAEEFGRGVLFIL
jgi:hypothetical protein